MTQSTASDPGTVPPTTGGLETGADDFAPRSSRRMWPWALLLLLIVAGFGGWYYYFKRNASGAIQFQTAAVSRGDIVQEVTANGSLTPVKQVEVGSQVSGIIEKIYVDFNSKVKEDELLAQIDPSTYQKNLAQAKAQLNSAKAALELAQVNYKRAEELFKDKLISASDHDSAVAAFHQAEATVQIQEAAVERSAVDLGYTQIKAPISGVVISRAVDEGQTVASSFNTPRLFVIANDLTKMQIEAAVSEADVGGVDEGERVSFTVDAFPNRKFFGRVQQVRYAPITNQNVVTYTTVVNVDNPDMKLRPGMTATARLVTAEKKNVLRVPSAALRFRPPPNVEVKSRSAAGASGDTPAPVQTDSAGVPIPPWRTEGRRPNPGEREKWEATLTPDQRAKFEQAMQAMRQRFAQGGGGGMGGGPGGPPSAKPEGPTTATVYILKQGTGTEKPEKPVLEAITVKAGVTDGLFTEVLDGLNDGDQVVTRVTTLAAAATNAPTQNPFSPFGGRRR